MYQSFSSETSPKQGPARLHALREAMTEPGVDGFLIPRADAHQGEYVAPCDERLAWLTGFTGSAGFCAVLVDQAGVFIDGRYTLQVRDQVDTEHFTPVNWPATQLADWLSEHMPSGSEVGFDPWLHTVQDIRTLTDKLANKNIVMRPIDNLIDRIWSDRPTRPANPLTVYPIELSGQTSEQKISAITDDCDSDIDHRIILTLPDSICWLLNIRGADVTHTPIAHCFAIISNSGDVTLFTDAECAADVLGHLGSNVEIRRYDGLIDYLCAYPNAQYQLDPNSAPCAVMACLRQNGTNCIEAPDPCILPKARKNSAEIIGAAEAHLRDGAAMAEFLCWLDQAIPQGGLTEIDVVTKLEGFRRATNALREISFDTICGSGPNGAIVHYRVTQDSNRTLHPGELLLIDSGGQYLDGTTDITRTVPVGTVGQEEKSCFTRVLQGMITMSRACWPKGLSGRDLDALARVPLWQAGLDYDHGTGHGVGAYLSVHEGPARLSRISDVPLEPGMILSNEPGYYRANAFGIRIENLIVVEAADKLEAVENRPMHQFHTLTYVPIDRRLVMVEMLSQAERDWINQYHQTTHDLLYDCVSPDCQSWLDRACAAL